MHDILLFLGNSYSARLAPGGGFRLRFDEEERIAKYFRDRIEKEFGKQVLNDVLSVGSFMVFIDNLEKGDNPMWEINLWHSTKQRECLENLYDIEFVSEEVMRKNMEESGRLEKREMNLWEEWANLYDDQWLESSRITGVISP